MHPSMAQGMDWKQRAEGNYLYSGEDRCLERADASHTQR
jgi:hypothetical protein